MQTERIFMKKALILTFFSFNISTPLIQTGQNNSLPFLLNSVQQNKLPSLAWHPEANSCSETPFCEELTVAQSISILETLQKNVIAVMDNLYHNRNYWQQAQYRSLGYFFEKGPLKWLTGKKQSQEVQENLEVVEHELIHQAHLLGHLQEIHNELSKEEGPLKKENAQQVSKKIQSLLPKNHDCSCSYKDLIKKAQNYKKETLKRLHVIQAPGHFQRNWIGYSIAALTTLYGYDYWQKNHGLILQTMDQSATTAQHFFNYYIKEPIKNSVDIIYGKEKNDLIISDKIIKEREDILEPEFTNYLQNNSTYSKDEITRIVKESIRDRALPADMQKRSDQESRNLTYYIISPSGKILNISYIKAALLELMAYDRLKKMDRLLETNKLNFELLIALPATAAISLLGYLSYKMGNKLYYTVFSRPEVKYKEIKQALIKVEAILNTHQDKKLIDHALQGQIFYWVHKLQQLIDAVPFVDRTNFGRDLNELNSLEFTVNQKMNTITRMFRTYPFLG